MLSQTTPKLHHDPITRFMAPGHEYTATDLMHRSGLTLAQVEAALRDARALGLVICERAHHIPCYRLGND